MSQRITLKPSPGFVIKTVSLEVGLYTPSAPPSIPANNKTLEPVSRSIAVTAGHKVFLNVAFDSNVPPPRKASEVDIRRALAGDEDGYFVPVVICDGREMADKAGKPSLVFDAVFNETLRERTSKDGDFRTYIIEVALERVEERSGLSLGREIATPNIKSKGPLEERTVLVPPSLSAASASGSKSLIEEITPSLAPASATNKVPSPSRPTSSTTLATKKSSASTASTKPSKPIPDWSLQLENTGPKKRAARIEVKIPLATRADFENMALDVERNRLIVSCGPNYAPLDVPVLAAAQPSTGPSLGLDIDSARAEWRIEKGLLVVTANIVG